MLFHRKITVCLKYFGQDCTSNIFPSPWPWTSIFKPFHPSSPLPSPPSRACEPTKWKQKQNQVMSHSNWPRNLLFDLADKQCYGINKEWLHCLTPESVGRFLVNNILCLTQHDVWSCRKSNFFFIKKDKDWASRTLAITAPPTHRAITAHFCLSQPPLPSNWAPYLHHP